MRRKTFKLLFAAIALAGCLPFHSAHAERQSATIMGSQRCDVWLQDRKKAAGNDLYDWTATVHGRAWLLGFLSALNTVAEEEKDLLEAIDVDTVSEWVDRYCAKHTKDRIDEAATALFLELRNAAK